MVNRLDLKLLAINLLNNESHKMASKAKALAFGLIYSMLSRSLVSFIYYKASKRASERVSKPA